MAYVGMDLHKKTVQISVMDDRGIEISNTSVQNSRKTLEASLRKIPPDAKYVLESSSVWRETYRLMTEDMGLDVILSNPYRTKIIAESKKKTDKVDARVLADMLRGGYIAECHVPGKQAMAEKDLVRYRTTMVRSRTLMKNKIHGILLQGSVKPVGAPFTIGWTARVRSLNDYRIDGYLAVIDFLKDRIVMADARISDAVKKNPDAMLINTIPGVGNYSALVIASCIDGIDRFIRSEKLSAYAGLVPSVRSSGETAHYGRITRRGDPLLRWIMTECIHSHAKYAKDSDVTKFYRRLAKKRGTSKAAVAAASKMLRVIYWMLKEKRGFVTNYG